ncbi:SemiSWEET transporter [Pedobacter metabolipauper]|uniref:MtN3 and saliva related transmembrane protein n=1 Tax=Pedobacter metabolipauper TaxID=425513 RepID=A0A4R6SWR1_9SPHI|nr:SemiSWEET transporter [Pedobacter metabolipauper]TDQ09836.1 MtN3 and saliva related transmembrane protein [Pedobacter metabolipauper]
MQTELIFGLSAGILTSASTIPQVIKTIKEKDVEHVSPLMFIILLCGNGLWVYYGLLKSDLPITITNSFSVLMDLTMLFLKFRYKK